MFPMLSVATPLLCFDYNRVACTDATLYFRKSGRTQKVITTKTERDAVLESSHLGTAEDATTKHVNGDDMLADIEPRYKWADMKLDIDDWVHIVYIYHKLLSLTYKVLATG